MSDSLVRRFADSEFFWGRHANPASGWSRVPMGPLLMYAVYARNWKLLAATVAFMVVNPVLFPAVESEESGEESGETVPKSWMTRGVRGEQLWLRGADAGRANLLNAANVAVFGYALYAAVRRRPARTAAFTALGMALKLAFVNEMAKLYDRERAGKEI